MVLSNVWIGRSSPHYVVTATTTRRPGTNSFPLPCLRTALLYRSPLISPRHALCLGGNFGCRPMLSMVYLLPVSQRLQTSTFAHWTLPFRILTNVVVNTIPVRTGTRRTIMTVVPAARSLKLVTAFGCLTLWSSRANLPSFTDLGRVHLRSKRLPVRHTILFCPLYQMALRNVYTSTGWRFVTLLFRCLLRSMMYLILPSSRNLLTTFRNHSSIGLMMITPYRLYLPLLHRRCTTALISADMLVALPDTEIIKPFPWYNIAVCFLTLITDNSCYNYLWWLCYFVWFCDWVIWVPGMVPKIVAGLCLVACGR